MYILSLGLRVCVLLVLILGRVDDDLTVVLLVLFVMCLGLKLGVACLLLLECKVLGAIGGCLDVGGDLSNGTLVGLGAWVLGVLHAQLGVRPFVNVGFVNLPYVLKG